MDDRLAAALGVSKPLLSAPMGGAAGPDLVAAVCNAGAYGMIPLWHKPVAQLREDIAAVRARTDRPFAVNLNLSRPFEAHLEACIAAKVHAVSLFWGENPDAIARAKDAGLVVLASIGTAAEARAAEAAGADVIIAQGWEAGGHVWGRVSTLALIPAVVDAVSLPVVAAGGIADGRGMAAALLLGAAGVCVGTRFLASQEAAIHPDYRANILAAGEADTEWYADLYDIGWPNAPHRALRNATAATWHDAGRPPLGARPGEDDVIGQRPDGQPVLRYASYTPGLGTTGDISAMSQWAGQGVGLVRTVQPAAEIVEELCTDAARHLKGAPHLI